eukprot:bmy_09225T0
MEDPNQAMEWLMQLISVVPTDSRALSKLGGLYDSEGDKSQAFQYYYESYRYFPSNIEVIEWLGAYYIDTQFCNYQKALDTYKDIHRKFPENVECLRFLIRLCTDIGLKEVQEYATKLKRLEKMKEIREQRTKSGRDGSGGPRGRRDGSAGSDGGQNCSAGSRGERLSAQLRALPRTEEPYDSSSNKELGKCPGLADTSTWALLRVFQHRQKFYMTWESVSLHSGLFSFEDEPHWFHICYASYVDPLGPQIERPRTAAKKRVDEDDFADEELGDDLLPE